MRLTLLILFIFIGKSVFATDYYCDPVNGNINNDGSQNFPWSKLEDVFDAGKDFQSGDVIYLLDGYHGNVSVKGVNLDYVSIKNFQGSSPKLSRLQFGTVAITSRWIIEGLLIGAEFNGVYHKNTLLYTGNNASFIKIKNCTIFSKEDISSWTLDDWNNNVSNGVIFAGSNCSIENSMIKNIRTGIQFEGNNCTAYSNKVQNFAGDGMRGLADNGVFEYNLVQDNYVIDSNHDDGFQSWTNDGGVGKGTLKNIVLLGNIFINYTDTNRDFLGPMQGIFGTDGMFEDFIIENNVVIVDHWHGISLYGATNCKIINNTVTDTYFGALYPNHPDSNVQGPLGPTWIKVSNHKNGTQSSGNIIRNNIANQIVLDNANVGIQDYNLTLIGHNSTDYETEFVDWQNFDFHLNENSSAIDNGSENLAPVFDADKNSRLVGSSFDIGAYEYGDQISEGEISSSLWQTFSMDNFTNELIVEFDLKPNQSNMNGVTGILSGMANTYTDLSCIIRLNTTGKLDVYNLDNYAYDTTIDYQFGDIFHVKMLIDIFAQDYDVIVSKNGEAEIILANNYSFRKISGNLNAWAIKKEQGSHTITNINFYSGSLTIDDEFLDKNFEIHPTLNIEGEFNISFLNNNYENLKISLFDLNGRKIDVIQLNKTTNKSTFKFNNYHQLDSGIYFVLIQNSTKYQIIKIYKDN